MERTTIEEPKFDKELGQFILNLSNLLKRANVSTELKNIFYDFQSEYNKIDINFIWQEDTSGTYRLLAKELKFFNQEVIEKKDDKIILNIATIILDSIKKFMELPLLSILQEILKITRVLI